MPAMATHPDGYRCPAPAPVQNVRRSQSEGEAMHPTDVDPQETREWLEALDAVVANDGVERAQQLVESVIDRARRVGAPPPDQGPTPYVNTIPPQLEAPFSGDLDLEHKIRSA